MIRLPQDNTLTPEQRHAVSVLVECSRALPSQMGDGVVMRVFADRSPGDLLDATTQIRVADGMVEISGAALELVTRIGSAVDEQRSSRADRFGRVPPGENYLVARGLERDVVIDRFGLALRAAILRAASGRRLAFIAPWPEGKRWAMAMTHDLDVVALWPAFTALRALELARKGRIGDVTTVLGRAVTSVFGDPVYDAARHVLETEAEKGIVSTWFVITGTPTPSTIRAGDITYSPESPAAKRIIRAVRDAGHDVGLHGSFETWTEASRFTSQRERLERIVERTVKGVRQHFIRMRPGATHQAMRAAGFTYDSTFGFADRNGFRLGTALPMLLWDDSLKRTLSIQTIPFTWMDRALSKYRGVEDPHAWVEDALATASTCREAEGVWTGIWHPNLSATLGFPGAREAFEELCLRLMADRPWAASLDQICEWRAARRSLRAVGVTDDGVILTAQADGVPIPLEDASGNPIPSRTT